ncbi:hypothetical protein GCM10007053_08190 [Halioglobus pacificus]|uniref:Transposase DDE domain-containing protein n=1 Tax=Parahalioglobus pacificus TaxID=930806 RepID=A0A918XFQ0_9GAMM|nr:hypothetical protein GCM10007053_08190 [Halioglobus pacificus]
MTLIQREGKQFPPHRRNIGQLRERGLAIKVFLIAQRFTKNLRSRYELQDMIKIAVITLYQLLE